MIELLTDELVKQTYMVPDFQHPTDAAVLAEKLIDLSEDPERCFFGVYLSQRFIGVIHQTDASEDRIEVGYALHPLYHNRGYCTEALRAVIAHFFTCGFREVVAGAFSDNLSSIRVMVKSGMRPMSRREELAYRGRNHSCIYYSIRRGDASHENL